MVPFRGTFVDKYSASNYRNRYSSSNSSDGIELVLVTVSSESFKLSFPSGCKNLNEIFQFCCMAYWLGLLRAEISGYWCKLYECL